MKKIIKKWGDSNVILLDKEDMKIYELKTGDVVEVAIMQTHLTDEEDDGVEG